MTEKLNRRFHNEWTTVGVTPMPPGFMNYYKQADGETASPCPAVLLQELRMRLEWWDEPTGKESPTHRTLEREHRQTPPFDTRVVAAEICDGELVPAGEWVGNYAGTEYPTPGADLGGATDGQA